MFKKVLFLTIFLSSIVWANGLKNFADGVVSVKESGGTISTRDRTVLFGGGYTMKTPNIRLTPFNVTAPSLKAGCGGIDMVFGSLGFLNKEQFVRSEEHTSELQSRIRISYAVFCLKKIIYTVVF